MPRSGWPPRSRAGSRPRPESRSTTLSPGPRRSAATTAERQHDIVLFGATGFTGGLTAEYLAAHAPETTRWALAGRNREKLEGVRSRLATTNPRCAELPLLQAHTGDAAAIRDLADSTRVVISTAGPYILHGEPLVAACAASGTDYVDLTGEPEFVDLMWLRYHAQAERSGARIVHSCGFDSIPYDLGALFTVEQLPEGVPIALEGFVSARGTFSGGTFHSALEIMGRLRQAQRVAAQRREIEPRPKGRRVRGIRGKPHEQSDAGGWVVPFPTIDAQNVLRSARALDRYGPDFSYSHYLVAGPLPVMAGIIAAGAGFVALAQLAPARDLLGRLKDPGEGPSPEQRAKGWFRVRMVARADGTRLVTEISGGDPGYGETSKMLAESALCLAHDELPERAGQLTPAVAMGDALLARLRNAGIEFKVVE
ncbi:MAG: saccharopine dehydrogenase NADP-binding domain-containing protein [Solirubrobacterales bacterium]|nr:saccharopine dehydrogenase NADP-binding domain-containing protein [Solirubrobacterales bacterium]